MFYPRSEVEATAKYTKVGAQRSSHTAVVRVGPCSTEPSQHVTVHPVNSHHQTLCIPHRDGRAWR